MTEMDWSKLSRQIAALVLVFALVVTAVPLASLNGSAQSVTAPGGSEEWSFATGGRIQSSPTVADDTVYVGSNDNNVYALDTTDGSKQWSFSTGGKVRSSPTVADGTVYVGSYDSNIYALDATDGTQQWSFSTGGKVRSSLTAADGTVYAASNDNKVYALDATDGSKQWSFKTGTGIESSPTIVDGTVYIGGNDNKVYALNATDGSKQWSFATGGPIISSPTVADGTVYVGNTNSNVLALDATDGSKQWSFSTGNDVRSSPTVADGTVYVGSYDSNVYALDATDGSKQWSFSTGDVVWSSPTVAAGTVYVGGGDNSLYALDATDGTQQWSFSTGDDVRSSPTVVDGTVYVGGWDNNVYALGTDHTKSSTGSRVTLETLGMLGTSFYTDTVSGTVTDADGNALNGANVTVKQSGSVVTTTTTDSSGAYSVDLQDGDYTITANDAEYQAVSKAVTVSGSAKTVDYQLPDYTISGTVTDTAGDPIGNATVAIGSGSTDYATTNAESEYSITVDGGSYEKIAAAKSGFAMNSTTLYLDGNKTVDLTLTDQSNPTTGTVYTGYQEPAPGAKIDVIDPTTGEIVDTTLTDATGQYSLDKTGEYKVRANRADTRAEDIQTTLEAGGTIEPLYVGSETTTTTAVSEDATDPLTGGDLDTLNTSSIAECNPVLENKKEELLAYGVTGGLLPIVETASDGTPFEFTLEEDGCQVDTAKQERLALLVASTTLNQSEQNRQAVANNYLTDARSVAYSEGKITAYNAIADGAVVEQAQFEANESVDAYYQSMYETLASSYSTSVLQSKYIYEREYAQTDATGEWVYPVAADGTRLQFAASPWEEATVSLPQGDKTMWTYRLSSGELVTPYPNRTEAPGGGPYISGPSLRVVGPDDTSSTLSGGAYTTVADSEEFASIVTTVDDQRQLVSDNLAVAIEETLANYDANELNATDFLSPTEIASRASTDYQETGYYGFAATTLAAQGYSGNLNTSHTVALASGETVDGTLFYTGDDLTQIENGTQYDPTSYEGRFLFAANEEDGGIQELTAPFEVTRQTSTQTGDPVQNATLQEYTYNTTNTEELENSLGTYQQLANAYDDVTGAAPTGGGVSLSLEQLAIVLLVAAGAALALFN